jgi:small subunit ribosomal protein S20
MANTSSAKKSARQSEKRKEVNLGRRTAIKTAVKKVIIALENDSTENLDTLLRHVAAQLGRAKSKGLMHPNTAARKLSRLAKKVAQAKNPVEAQ